MTQRNRGVSTELWPAALMVCLSARAAPGGEALAAAGRSPVGCSGCPQEARWCVVGGRLRVAFPAHPPPLDRGQDQRWAANGRRTSPIPKGGDCAPFCAPARRLSVRFLRSRRCKKPFLFSWALMVPGERFELPTNGLPCGRRLANPHLGRIPQLRAPLCDPVHRPNTSGQIPQALLHKCSILEAGERL